MRATRPNSYLQAYSLIPCKALLALLPLLPSSQARFASFSSGRFAQSWRDAAQSSQGLILGDLLEKVANARRPTQELSPIWEVCGVSR